MSFKDCVPPSVALAFSDASLVGTGSAAYVYRATETASGQVCAIKVLRNDSPDSQRLQQRFLREVAALARIEHRNVVQCHESQMFDDRAVVIMEFVEGQTLAEVLQDSRLSPHEAITIATQLADGISAIHGAELLHRDLKPLNVMLDRNGTVRIMDFGLAKFIGSSALTEMTRTGEIVGTYAYIAPESLCSNDCDGRSDLYQIGVILFEMLTGETPFSIADLAVMSSGAPLAKPPSLTETWASPPTLAKLVHRAIAVAPEQRFQNATELANACRNWLASPEGLAATTPLSRQASTRRKKIPKAAKDSISSEHTSDPTPQFIDKHLRWWLAAAVSIIVTSVLAAVWFRSSEVRGRHPRHGAEEKIHDAARDGDGAALLGIIGSGGDVNSRGDLDATALHRAAWAGKSDTVAILLHAGADVNARDRNGRTPLHRAAEGGHRSVISQLLKQGADGALEDDDSLTAADLAKRAGHEELVTMLERAAHD